jgi:hypothetical protein
MGRLRFDTLRLPGAAPRTGPRRVVITDPQVSTSHPELAAIGGSVVGSLRNALSGRKEYQLVDQNEVRGVLAQTHEASQVAARLGADVIASVDLIPVPGDSVVLLVKIRDLTAQPQYSYRVAGGRTMATSELPAGAGPMVDAALGYIDEMTGAPRRSTRIVVVPQPPATPDR